MVFQNFPIVVGAAGSLKESGDYFLHDYTGMPIVVMKGKDNQIRAFLNICRHRGVRLLEEEKGHIKANIVCPYHAWTYDTAGCLKGIFHSEGFNNVSADSHSLIELDCFVRLGLIFVVPNPDLKGKFNIDTYLQEVYMITDGIDYNSYVPHLPLENKEKYNWKLGVDGGTEAYHFKITHKNTLAPHVYDNVGVVIEENKLHPATIYPKRSIEQLKDQPESNWVLTDHGNILLHIFPNTTFLVMADHVMVVPVFPQGERANIAKSFMLIPQEPQNTEEENHWKANYDIFWTTIKEDNEKATLQQQSFDGYNGMNMTIGSFETLILQFEQAIDKVLNGELRVTDFQ